jgi:hypothetical protein
VLGYVSSDTCPLMKLRDLAGCMDSMHGLKRRDYIYIYIYIYMVDVQFLGVPVLGQSKVVESKWTSNDKSKLVHLVINVLKSTGGLAGTTLS